MHKYILQTYMTSLCVECLWLWNGTRLVTSSFLISTSWFLILAEAFRHNYIAACSTARRSVTERNEMSGQGTVPCLAKISQHSSTADLIKFYWRHQNGSDGTRTEQLFTFEVTLLLLQLFMQVRWLCQSQFNYCSCRLIGGFILINTKISYKYSTF